LVAVPSIGRATEVTPRRAAPEADATRDLYERYARQIYSYCLHQLGNREEAEDATQSTFLNAFRGFKRGVDPEFESAWVYKIAQNVCLTRQRSSSRRRKVETPGDLEAMQDYVPAHQADPDELIRLPEALDAMPEQQRRALLLREWQGLSYKEIGEELDLSQAAVETLLFRARRSLAAGLIEEQQPPKKAAGMAKRLGAGDLGSILSIVKSLVLTGGVKVATAVATVAATSVVAATPVTRHAVEDIVTPRPDKAPMQHVSVKAAAGTRAAQVGAPFSLVPARAAAAPAARNASLTAAAAKARRHKSALPASNSTAGAGVRVGHAPSSTEPSAAIAAPPAVDTAAPAPAPAADPAPAAASPAPQPAPSQPAADKPKSDSGSNGDGQTPSAVAPPKKDDGVPTVVQDTAAVTPAVRANDRNLASNGEGKQNDDDKKNAGKADKKDARQATPPTVITTTPADLTTPTTTSTTTTSTTPAVTPPTTTTTTTAAPTPVPPVVTTPATQPTQSSRPAEGHKPDGRGDNGNGNDGNGKKK
jgi:RNA polymerase sigma factor (sigma-70 family)